MKTLHFHIGSERCGSTLIQAFFNQDVAKQALAQYGLVYDPEIFLETAKLTPLTGFDEARLRPIRETLFARHLEADYDGVFTTQELLLGLAHDSGVSNRCAMTAKIAAYLTEGFDTRLIIVLRRQDTFVESLYNQVIKRGETRDFATFVDELPLDNYHWDRVVDTFADRFGRDAVTVIPFEKAVVASAGRTNFVEGVFWALGVPATVDLTNVPAANPSLSPRVLEIERLANRLLTREEAHALASWLSKTIPKRPDDPHGLLTDDARAALLARYRESNARLFFEFLPDHDPAYYLEAGPVAAGP